MHVYQLLAQTTSKKVKQRIGILIWRMSHSANEPPAASPTAPEIAAAVIPVDDVEPREGPLRLNLDAETCFAHGAYYLIVEVPETWSVMNLKFRVHELEGISPNYIHLVLITEGGRVRTPLVDDRKVTDYSLAAGSSVRMTLRMPRRSRSGRKQVSQGPLRDQQEGEYKLVIDCPNVWKEGPEYTL